MTKTVYQLTLNYVKLRKHMFDKRLCFVDLKRLRCLNKITNHLNIAKHYTESQQLIQVRFLLPELECIMPGTSSAKFESCKNMLDKIKELANG